MCKHIISSPHVLNDAGFGFRVLSYRAIVHDVGSQCVLD